MTWCLIIESLILWLHYIASKLNVMSSCPPPLLVLVWLIYQLGTLALICRSLQWSGGHLDLMLLKSTVMQPLMWDQGKDTRALFAEMKRGSVLTMSSRPIFAVSALIAEAISLRDVVSLGCNLNLHQVIFESDSQVLVEARKNISRGEIQGLVDDINQMRSQLHDSGITWVNRLGNQSVHARWEANIYIYI